VFAKIMSTIVKQKKTSIKENTKAVYPKHIRC